MFYFNEAKLNPEPSTLRTKKVKYKEFLINIHEILHNVNMNCNQPPQQVIQSKNKTEEKNLDTRNLFTHKTKIYVYYIVSKISASIDDSLGITIGTENNRQNKPLSACALYIEHQQSMHKQHQRQLHRREVLRIVTY